MVGSVRSSRLQIIGQQLDNPSIALDALSPSDRQRIDLLRQRVQRLKKQADDVRKANLTKKTPTDSVIDTIDVLIKRTRDVEEQIQKNVKQPTSEYEPLILDCQVSDPVATCRLHCVETLFSLQRIIKDLDQNLHEPVEQAIQAGKRLYSSDSKDGSGIESNGRSLSIVCSETHRMSSV